MKKHRKYVEFKGGKDAILRSIIQEAKDEAKTASVCYKNFGVEFTMLSTIDVKGKNAHSIFKHLAKHSKAPSWNFNKYLVSADGERVKYLPSSVIGDELLGEITAIEAK